VLEKIRAAFIDQTVGSFLPLILIIVHISIIANMIFRPFLY
jgi:hypothetical protein